jgi:hypothetical protein
MEARRIMSRKKNEPPPIEGQLSSMSEHDLLITTVRDVKWLKHLVEKLDKRMWGVIIGVIALGFISILIALLK